MNTILMYGARLILAIYESAPAYRWKEAGKVLEIAIVCIPTVCLFALGFLALA